MTKVIIDVEAKGSTPMNGIMTEFGAVALNDDMTAVRSSFHGKLVNSRPDPANPARAIIDEDAEFADPRVVLDEFVAWLHSLNDDHRFVFVSDNPAYDFMWIACLFDQHSMPNPFGYSGRRIGDFAAGLERKYTRSNEWKKLRVTRHSHHPVDDAMGNAEALITLIARSKAKVSRYPF